MSDQVPCSAMEDESSMTKRISTLLAIGDWLRINIECGCDSSRCDVFLKYE